MPDNQPEPQQQQQSQQPEVQAYEIKHMCGHAKTYWQIKNVFENLVPLALTYEAINWRRASNCFDCTTRQLAELTKLSQELGLYD